jgi:hypothetical protein
VSRPLNARMRAFADAWQGPGTGADAARAAGYSGTSPALRVRASELLRDPRIRARILERLGPHALDAPEVPPADPIAADAPPLVKGKGRGTATERIEISMRIARNPKADPKDRLAAVRLAAELERELPRGSAGLRGGTPSPIALPAPPARSGTPGTPPKLKLVLSDADAERADG